MPSRRIILSRLSGFWSARFDHSPDSIAAGNSPRAALAELIQNGSLSAGRYRLDVDRDKSDLEAGHAEVVLQHPAWKSCDDCHGSGRRVTADVQLLCEACDGCGSVRAG